MGFGMAVPSLASFGVPLLCFLAVQLDQVLGDGLEDILKDDAYEPYDLDAAYADSAIENGDFLEDFGYGTDSLDEYAGYGEDSLFYYSDEFEEYYNTYGIYTDEYGYDYLDTETATETDCKLDDKGKATMKGAVFDLCAPISYLVGTS